MGQFVKDVGQIALLIDIVIHLTDVSHFNH